MPCTLAHWHTPAHAIYSQIPSTIKFVIILKYKFPRAFCNMYVYVPVCVCVCVSISTTRREKMRFSYFIVHKKNHHISRGRGVGGGGDAWRTSRNAGAKRSLRTTYPLIHMRIHKQQRPQNPRTKRYKRDASAASHVVVDVLLNSLWTI